MHAPTPTRTAPTVLVIEDDPGIQALLQDTLDEGGYTVLTAVGDRALRLARERQPAVILLDLLMPQMDGAEVRRRLRADPATAAIPVVVMSAHASRRLAAQLGDAYLPKPFDLPQLLATVAHWTTAGAAACTGTDGRMGRGA
jgi:CheY-like chemotaxis protein